MDLRYILLLLWICPYSSRTQGDELRCAATICDRSRQKLRCDTGKLLLTNVTDITTGHMDNWAYQNLRRMCMGKAECDPQAFRFCESRFRLKVSYLCASESADTCSDEIETMSTVDGFIRSPLYPDTSIQKCKWRIIVPDNHYLTISVHDLVQSSGSPVVCKAGVKLMTSQKCVNYTLPEDTICSTSSIGPLISCGDVDVSLVPSDSGQIKVRLWLSFRLTQYGEEPDINYLTHLSRTCPQGAHDTEDNPAPHDGITLGHIAIEPDSTETTVTETGTTRNMTYRDRKHGVTPNTAEKAVFYIAIVIAALSLTGLIIVTVVCVRRQRHLKATGVINNTRPPSLNSHSANRPLPPISKNKEEQNGHVQFQDEPNLSDGYSSVADELHYNSSQYAARSPAYAEVDDNISPLPVQQIFRHGGQGQGRKLSLENVYCDVDGDGWKIYHEIPESGASTPNDQIRLLKHKESKHSNSPKGRRKNGRRTSFEGPYCEMSETKKIISKELSDSDGSLVLSDNEVYDSYQSAHV